MGWFVICDCGIPMGVVTIYATTHLRTHLNQNLGLLYPISAKYEWKSNSNASNFNFGRCYPYV